MARVSRGNADQSTADPGVVDAEGSASANGSDAPVGGDSSVASELAGEELSISYPGVERPIVECESVIIPEGEVTALVGPNGSGKSTLLKCLSNQLAADRGTVLLDGADVHELGTKELARKVGLLSQENESPQSLTVENLVYHGRYPYRGFFDGISAEDEAAVERAIELAGVDHLRDSAVGSLSGGQKQLAWIAMVFAQDTDVLLLDEPTTYLDLHHQLRVMEVVRTLNREYGTTIAVVLHDLAQAARFADNLIAMKDGELYDWGPPKKVVTEALLEDVFRVVASVDADGPDGPKIQPHRAIDD
ncbi:ABC transporter ATP-binding protein [Haloferacaceae archaeon DSL9]